MTFFTSVGATPAPLCTGNLQAVSGTSSQEFKINSNTTPVNYPYWSNLTGGILFSVTRLSPATTADLYFYNNQIGVSGLPASKGVATTVTTGSSSVTTLEINGAKYTGSLVLLPNPVYTFSAPSGATIALRPLFNNVVANTAECPATDCPSVPLLSTGAIIFIVALSILFLIALILYAVSASSARSCAKRLEAYQDAPRRRSR